MLEYAIFAAVVMSVGAMIKNAAAFFAPRPRIIWCEPDNEDY